MVVILTPIVLMVVGIPGIRDFFIPKMLEVTWQAKLWVRFFGSVHVLTSRFPTSKRARSPRSIARFSILLLGFIVIRMSWFTGWWFQKFFISTPTWGRFPFWLIIFQLGWNHQPVYYNTYSPPGDFVVVVVAVVVVVVVVVSPRWPFWRNFWTERCFCFDNKLVPRCFPIKTNGWNPKVGGL